MDRVAIQMFKTNPHFGLKLWVASVVFDIGYSQT